MSFKMISVISLPFSGSYRKVFGSMPLFCRIFTVAPPFFDRFHGLSPSTPRNFRKMNKNLLHFLETSRTMNLRKSPKLFEWRSLCEKRNHQRCRKGRRRFLFHRIPGPLRQPGDQRRHPGAHFAGLQGDELHRQHRGPGHGDEEHPPAGADPHRRQQPLHVRAGLPCGPPGQGQGLQHHPVQLLPGPGAGAGAV